jgi:glycosyltransferase involved in cell wall biosynthesis
VVFIGYWSPLKGSLDFGDVMRRLRSLVPGVRFLFLGTWFPESQVLRDLRVERADWIRVVPRFRGEELPRLLADATVGVFPSYVEGFPFAVLEKLSAGLPPVSYDAPGAREVLRAFEPPLMVPRGDTRAFADRVASILTMAEADYRSLAEACTELAAAFRWESTARRTTEIYEQSLSRLRPVA